MGGLGMYRDPKKGAIGLKYPAVRRAAMQRSAFLLAMGGLRLLDHFFDVLSAIVAGYYSGHYGPAQKGYSLERAMAYEGRWEEAAQALWKAWEVEPDDPKPLWELCGLGFKYGQRPEVRGAAQELLKHEDLDHQFRRFFGRPDLTNHREFKHEHLRAAGGIVHGHTGQIYAGGQALGA